jgi:hypothetical protein
MNKRARAQLSPLRRCMSLERAVAVLATVALQTFFALFLLLHDTPALEQEQAHSFRSVLEWIERTPLPLPSPPVDASPSETKSADIATRNSVPRPVPTGQPGAKAVESTIHGTPSAPLILVLPSPTQPGTFDSHALDRSRYPRPYEQTRFAKAWAPDGGPVQRAWAHRSRAAQLLLSATGALDFPCTDEEKRLRKPRCAGAQFAHDELE